MLWEAEAQVWWYEPFDFWSASKKCDRFICQLLHHSIASWEAMRAPMIYDTGLFTASGHFHTHLISVVDGPILKPFGVVIVITGCFGLVYNNAWQVARYLCKYWIKFGPIFLKMKYLGNPMSTLIEIWKISRLKTLVMWKNVKKHL